MSQPAPTAAQIEIGMQAVRRRMLDLGSRRGRGFTARFAARVLDLTAQNVRHHAAALDGSGLLRHQISRREGRRGRPPAKYFITQHGRAVAAIIGAQPQASVDDQSRGPTLGVAIFAQLDEATARLLEDTDVSLDLVAELTRAARVPARRRHAFRLTRIDE